ncbi:MAG: AAA family ATPase [Chloroflexota bacterium]
MGQLTKLTVHGYKSIKSLVELELRPINVLIGANGSGKSNLISFFRVLDNLARENLHLSVALDGGASSFLYDGPDVTPEIYAELHFQHDTVGYDYATRLTHTNDNIFIFTEEKVRQQPSDDGNGGDGWHHLKSIGRREAYLDRVKHDEGTGEPATYISETFKKCVIHQFHNTSAKSRIKQSQPMHDWWWLKSDAANLGPFLYRLRIDQPRYYQRIVDTLRLIFPFFEDFVLEPRNNMITLEWSEHESDMVFKAYQASDGTLRAMALVALLLQPTKDLPNLILLDEPELGLHPRAIDMLSGLIHRASHYTQIILATQSPLLLNYFEPDDVIVTERRHRESTYSRLNTSELHGWLEDYTLGELWEKNVTGGNP